MISKKSKTFYTEGDFVSKNKTFIATVKIGPKGQIIIPKEVREIFGLSAGDLLIMLADADRGIALERAEKLNDVVNAIIDGAGGQNGNSES